MEKMFIFFHTYIGEITVILLLCWLAVLLVILLQVITTRKKIDRITNAIQQYLEAIMEEEQGEEKSLDLQENEALPNSPKNSIEEEQNRLITAVLQEIFP